MAAQPLSQEQVNVHYQQLLVQAEAGSVQHQQLLGQLQQQQEQLLAVQANHQQAIAVAMAGQRGPQPRVAAPPMYDGEGANIESWFAGMNQQFEYYQYAGDVQRVRLAAASLKGPALNWWTTVSAQPTTWEGVMAGLRGRFQPITTAKIARHKLDQLEQGKLSINEYVAQFRELLILIPGMDMETQLHAFERGLKHSLQVILHQHDPQSLEEAITLAVRSGSMVVRSSSSSSSAAGSSQMDLTAIEASRTNAVTQADLHALITAMRNERKGHTGGTQGTGGGLNYIPRGPPKINGYSPVEVKAMMDAGKCFTCKKTGHQSRQCPERRQPGQFGGRRAGE